MVQQLLGGLALGLVLLLPRPAAAQASARADSAAVATAVAVATHQYDKDVRPESLLFNGPEYVNRTTPGTIGHPFFEQAEPQLGAVTYQGAHFEGVPLSYDLVLDQVVMTYPNQAVTIVLVPEKLAAFSLGSHQFVRVVADSATRGVLPTGFYELLQPGPVRLLAHHRKRAQQTTVQQNLRVRLDQVDRLLIRTAGAASEVTNLKTLLALLPAHQAEVQRYAREQKLRFGADQRAASALSALRYYYTLPQ
ncbi:MAG TPA: hypothetical protein VFO93_13410 [Hymenobacter sp.]|uniref:hypothetical protein n=1 Tax=Hymenobacter sp. TaxID=1898978 RepID=UPI002D7F1737|nr:hypothetical protein [Hymenobacter sp.]HET9504533.1 hypothetical protein [Hymenobacter sp.]